MKPVFAMLLDGAFVAGDQDSGMTSYAYPNSPHANVAKQHPRAVAEDMLSSERMSYRSVPMVKEHDLANWRRLRDAAEPFAFAACRVCGDRRKALEPGFPTCKGCTTDADRDRA